MAAVISSADCELNLLVTAFHYCLNRSLGWSNLYIPPWVSVYQVGNLTADDAWTYHSFVLETDQCSVSSMFCLVCLNSTGWTYIRDELRSERSRKAQRECRITWSRRHAWKSVVPLSLLAQQHRLAFSHSFPLNTNCTREQVGSSS